VGEGQERDVLILGAFKMKGSPVSYLWRAKDFREGIFNLPNASLCLSLLAGSRRTQSFTGCLCSIIASLRSVASVPTAWGRGCVRTVFWCCW